jgi:hypothetical protein
VFFDFNSVSVQPEFFNAALQLAEALKHYPNDKIRITGHTDANGSQEYNIELGKRRAQAVADILLSSGIEKNRIIIDSKGAATPLSVVSSKDMDKLNRRVQFEVITGGMLQENNPEPKESTDKKEKKGKIKPKGAVKDKTMPAPIPKTKDPGIDSLFNNK